MSAAAARGFGGILTQTQRHTKNYTAPASFDTTATVSVKQKQNKTTKKRKSVGKPKGKGAKQNKSTKPKSASLPQNDKTPTEDEHFPPGLKRLITKGARKITNKKLRVFV